MDAEAGENLEEAQALIERALELDPENGAYLDSLGWVFFKMGRLDKAIAYLERAALQAGDDPVVFDHLGDAYFMRREWGRARRNWERALELDATQTAIQDKLNRLPQEVLTGP
jgi:tetratricopeptide (TPR) repeat protein